MDLEQRMIERARNEAVHLHSPEALDPLVKRLSDARVVMLGEASHGTQEFYSWRRLISQKLIQDYGYDFIVVEGDWPSCMAVERYVAQGIGENPESVLRNFRRWPTWMWANSEIVRLIDWMRAFNVQNKSSQKLAHFFGLDVYSLFDSIREVVSHLDRISPFLARKARARYACFDPFDSDEIAYATSTLSFPPGCQEEVGSALREILELRMKDSSWDPMALLDAEQNALIVKNAEDYYRVMMRADDSSWNIRDRHMMDTLDRLLEHFGPESRAIVWAHNTHIGDYRATDMKRAGMVNLGGLARERYGQDHVALLGFGTHRGHVIASHAWDGPTQSIHVPPARPHSIESAFHDVAHSEMMGAFYLLFDEAARSGPLAEMAGHRAIGVVYDPTRERWGNYVPSSLANRYDAFLFVDETHALNPLSVDYETREMPETFPVGQ